ncbi:methyltransferase domain-containing protein [Fulvivirga sedimenti]|uniref:Methyltransferase domain-containing protein n=1 Tax=Fulvivirga sedimenti TaxID=2879465 RepID=A0A9X1HWF3_9BACT|nr:methyltransferase domain-containing protein [Fulvivirga sedimenti]MCA6078027.1 methyltransferase domain-containing protein [Fulvivirga sedimenti]
MKAVQAKKQTNRNGTGFRGPVDNPEAFLRPDWWRKIFNAMYLKTDADVVEDQKITATEVSLFTEITKISANDAVLDMACGQGRHLIELARRGYKNLNGIDRSRYLIQRGRNISRKEQLPVTFREGDVRKLPYQTDSFDLVTILGNSFGYFESTDDDARIIKEVFRCLKPNGQFLIDVSDGEYIRNHFAPRSWEWIDSKHFVCRERTLASDNERLISREVITHTDKGVIVDQFYAERLYTRESLRNLLDSVGFSDITFHMEISPDSQRNQDLGMMERRLIVTARAKKEWTPRKDRKKTANIVVVMGDPKRSDIIKPDAVFDDDDLETINQLKTALSSLDDYKITYLNNHHTLIDDLAKIKGKTDMVLNLCDEGFNNEATKELHVPALLEMLEIPYTGSGPQCLAFCYDKSLIRGIASEVGVPVARAFFIKPGDNLFEMNIAFPVIAKPNFGDSSFGITSKSVAYSIEELDDAILMIREKFGYAKPILVEEFLTGPEISLGIIGNPPEQYQILPIIEESYEDLPEGLPKICGYEAKWLVDSPYFKALKSVPANLPRETEQVIITCSLRLFERLECRDYCRFDWRLDEHGNPCLLEANPNPGWCWDGHLAKMAALDGISYPMMLDKIINSAIIRVNGMH